MIANFIAISIDLTYQCNYRCRHCFNSSGDHDYGVEMSDEELRRIVREISEFKPKGSCICGGEPLLRKDILFELIRIYKESKPYQGFNMVSNGYFLDEEIAKKLKMNGINSVQISLDGATPESHNWLRCNDKAFDRAINAIKVLVDAGIPANVACVPHKKNIEEIDAVIRLCEEMKVTALRMQPFMSLGRGRQMQDMILSDDEYFRLSRKIKKMSIEKSRAGINLEWGDPIEHLSAMNSKNIKLNFFSIDAYGDIILSPYIPLKFGNVKNHTIREYFDAGLLDVLQNPFVIAVAGLISDAARMNDQVTSKLPEIFTGQDIVLDFLHDDVNTKTKELLCKYELG